MAIKCVPCHFPVIEKMCCDAPSLTLSFFLHRMSYYNVNTSLGDLTRVVGLLREKVERLETEVDESGDVSTVTLGLVATGLGCLVLGAAAWFCRRRRRQRMMGGAETDVELGKGGMGGEAGATGIANENVAIKEEDEDDDGVLKVTLSHLLLSLNTKMGFF